VREIEGTQPPSHCVIPEGRTDDNNVKVNDVMKTIIESVINYNESKGIYDSNDKKCNEDLEKIF
jgi:hypothetical protein